MKSFRAGIDQDAPMSARRFAGAAPGASTAMLRLALVALALMTIAFVVLATR
jgi:hypothetical protein